jgi:PPOX class probable F420-dependent enzyme
VPSRREQIRMTQPEIEAFLASHSVGVLGTVDATGAPHMINMAYLYRDGEILFSSFAKAQKIVNLQRHPRASFLVEIPDPYHEIRGVLARGDVRVIDDHDVVRSTMEEIRLTQLRRSSSAQPPVDVARIAPKRVLCALKPDHIASWDHSRLGGVY